MSDFFVMSSVIYNQLFPVQSVQKEFHYSMFYYFFSRPPLSPGFGNDDVSPTLFPQLRLDTGKRRHVQHCFHVFVCFFTFSFFPPSSW